MYLKVLTNISLASGPVSDSFNITWKERSLTTRFLNVLYTDVSSVFTKIYHFSDLTGSWHTALVIILVILYARQVAAVEWGLLGCGVGGVWGAILWVSLI